MGDRHRRLAGIGADVDYVMATMGEAPAADRQQPRVGSCWPDLPVISGEEQARFPE
jgi:hypothetical protein